MVAGRFAQLSQKPNIGLVNPGFQRNKTGYWPVFLNEDGLRC